MSSASLKTYAAATVGTSAANLFTSTEDGITTLLFSAPASNTGTIYIGDSAVDASVARGIPVTPGGSGISITADAGRGGGTQFLNLSGIYADATTAGNTLYITGIKVA
jgi:hypothetical protein